MSDDAWLLADAGNTRIKWALAAGDTWLARGAAPTSAPAALRPAWVQLPVRPARVLACNVAGEAVRSEISAAASALGVRVQWVTSAASGCGVENGYEVPAQLGADRWAAAMGAWQREHAACVVVNAGTAITVDALDGSGRFRGGSILPGIYTMLDLLARRTYGLERQPGQYQAYPTNTGDAMWTGAIEAATGTVERMAKRLAADVGKAVRVLVSGGAAELLLGHLGGLDAEHVEHLVLEGLLAAARDSSAA